MNESESDRRDDEVEVTTPELYGESWSWWRVIGGSFAALVAVGAVVYWADGRSEALREGPRAPAEGVSPVNVAAQGMAVHEQGSIALEQSNTRETVVLAARPQVIAEPKLARMSVSFFLPPEGTVVPPTMLVRGMAKGVPEDKQLWLVTRRDPAHGVWPKEEIKLRSDGVFEREIWDFGGNGLLSVCLLVTDDAETSRYDDWLLAGDRLDEWPALIPDAEHSTVLGCQSVTLLEPKYP